LARRLLVVGASAVILSALTSSVDSSLTVSPPPSLAASPPGLPFRRLAVRVVRCGGMEIAVPSGEHAAATLIATTAVRLVRDWGLCSVPAVVDRARALGRIPVADDAARSVLATLPRTLWLDDDRHWFTFADPLGRLETALDKIFALLSEIRFDELRAALGRALIGAQEAPAAALALYLVELGRCAIGHAAPDKLVRRVPAFINDGEAAPAQPLTRPEAAVAQLLAQAGGELDARTLRRRARIAGVPRTTVNQLMKASPVLALVSPSRVRLIGSLPAAARA
jgi:hypothetical protein